jgi:hypothetical protein
MYLIDNFQLAPLLLLPLIAYLLYRRVYARSATWSVQHLHEDRRR